MVTSIPTHYPSLPLSSQPTPTPTGNSRSNPTVIEVPSLQNSTANFTSNSTLTPDQHYAAKYPNYTNSTPLFKDNNVKITHNTTWSTIKGGDHTNRSNVIQIATGDKPDAIKVNQPSDKEVQLEVNGSHYTLKINNNEDYPEELHIQSKGGDDRIRVDPRVTIPVTIEGGNGRDRIQALGSGDTRVYGGAGNDNITLGSGSSYAEGNDGNDLMRGGTGKTVMYGNNGNDVMSSGPGSKGTFSYMDGGNGNDSMTGESPTNIMHGGRGNDWMYGKTQTTFYTGRGRDTVISSHAKDNIFFKDRDTVSSASDVKRTKVTISNAGHEAFRVEGPNSFKQQTQDDLEFFRNSPTAQKMLTELDQAAKRNDSPVTIRETRHLTEYSHANEFARERDKQLLDYDDILNSPKLGFIHDNTKGDVATGAVIHNNPALIWEPPIFGLYHEMAHAYNGANGTFLPGQTQKDGMKSPEPNLERQAIGLETDAPAFDFDNDPSTPPTTTNPKPFNENALREEAGFTRRESYN